MFIFILLCIIVKTHDSYSFCPNCLHCTKPDRCRLLEMHPLFKDRPDVDLIGREICGDKGKYFISGLRHDEDHATREIYEQKTNIFKGKFIKKTLSNHL